MDWPAQSPDLNPIENLWSILDYQLRERKVTNKQELFACLQEGWNQISNEMLASLVDSMPRRCQAVIDAKGFATKY